MIIEKISTVRKDLKNLLGILKIVRAELKKAKENVQLAGKTLRAANLEQSSQFGFYDEIRSHLNILSNYIQIRLDERKAILFDELSKNSSLDYGERAREKLIESDSGYIDLKLQKLEVDELLDYAKSISEQFRMRAFSLNNISKLVAAQSQDEFFTLNE